MISVSEGAQTQNRRPKRGCGDGFRMGAKVWPRLRSLYFPMVVASILPSGLEKL
jgi:hypothetical protein